MERLISLIESDPLALIVSIVVFAYVGQWAVAAHEKQRVWGWRLALLAFALYVAFAVSRDGIGDAGLLASAAFRGLLAGGLMLGTSWVILSVCAFVLGHVSAAAANRARHRTRRREARERELDRQRSEQERWRAERERTAAEARLREEREQRAQQEQHEGKRRENARFTCESYYDRHRTKLADKFPPNRLDDYFQRYLGDDQPADEVERRAELLCGMLRELLEQDENGKPHRYQTITELNANFDQQREALIGSPMDGERIASLLAYLERERERAIREFNQR